MASVSATYASGKYLRAEELQGRGRVVFTIKSVQQKDLDGRKRLELAFRESAKLLTLNASNARALAGLYGDESAEWVGKMVVFVVRQVEFQGRQVPGIRVDADAPRTTAPDSPSSSSPVGQSITARIVEVKEQASNGRTVFLIQLDSGERMWTWESPIARAAKERCGLASPALLRYHPVRNPTSGVTSFKLVAVEDAAQDAPEGDGPAQDEIPF
ncbi:MAG: hypothetical protein HY291_02155 [Planctomycetes bacterium]|nr:hypothetical protein [Planctomycetota bacterium]